MSPTQVTAVLDDKQAVLDDKQDDARFLMCPMCHAPTSLTQAAVDLGADWRCVRCGQHFDATRLSALAAYAAWVADRAAGRPPVQGS
jgi:transcription initiation factor IIE alpha subunit